MTSEDSAKDVGDAGRLTPSDTPTGRAEDVREAPVEDVREAPVEDVREAPVEDVREAPVGGNPIGVTRTSLVGGTRTRATGTTRTSGAPADEALRCECWYRMLMLNLGTRKLQQVLMKDNGVGAWWCPLCNKIRRNEVKTQIRTCDSTELFIGYFGNSDDYASPNKQGRRTNTDMVAVFFKNRSVFVVAENDLTPTTKHMKQVSMERAVSTLASLLRQGANADLVSGLPRKQRIALLKRRCTIRQVRALRGWSIENPRQDAVRQWRLIAKSYNQIDLNTVLRKLCKTLNDEFDDDECAQISAAVQLADSEWPNQ